MLCSAVAPVGDKSKIEWTEATWNPVTGCDRTSPGCENCYALTLAKRLKAMDNPRYQVDGDPRTSGPGFGVTFHEDLIDKPLHWKRPRMIFVNSMSDLFHPKIVEAPEVDGYPFIAQVMATMVMAEQHTFQILTKRPKIMEYILADPMFRLDVNAALLKRGHPVMPGGMSEPDFRWPDHIWLGVSIESDRYTFRADHLRKINAVRFISAEPLLGPLPSLDLTGIDWVIVGGESGHGARPMHPRWVQDIRDACLDRPEPCEDPENQGRGHSIPVYENGEFVGGRACACSYTDPVAFFFKQWGAWAPGGHPTHDSRDVDYHGRFQLPGVDFATMMHHGTKAENGRELDGRTWDEMPRL